MKSKFLKTVILSLAMLSASGIVMAEQSPDIKNFMSDYNKQLEGDAGRIGAVDAIIKDAYAKLADPSSEKESSEPTEKPEAETSQTSAASSEVKSLEYDAPAIPAPVASPVPETVRDAKDMPKDLPAETATAPEMKPTVSTPVVPQDSQLNSDIKLQTFDSLANDLKIDAAFKEAKGIKLSTEKPVVMEVEIPTTYLTQSQIIRSVVKPQILTRKIDLDFDETALADIILSLSKMAEVNIVLDPGLKATKFDLHLSQVNIEEALLLIADSFGLGFKQIGDSLFMTHRQDLKDENVTSKVFKIKNINVTEAKELVRGIVPKVEVSTELNSLIVIGQPEDIIKVEDIIKKIDVPQPQVVLEAKIIEINRDALKDLGVDWSDQLNFDFQESGRPVTLDNIEDSADSAIKIFSMARTPVQFTSIIKMLENQNKAKVLSSPRVTTLNGKESEIFVGDRIPYTVTNVTGGVVTTDVRWVEPGIRLTIIPTIIGDDFVMIKVQPEVSFIFAFRGPNDEFPQVKTREATAYVRIKNNQPFVLGGLLNQEDKKNLFKVPMLGNIPFIGNLFSYEKHTSLDTELIITIIPTIVHDAVP